MGGLLIFHAHIAVAAIPPVFGSATLIVAAIFAAYVSGLILVDLTVASSSLLGFGLGFILGPRLTGKRDLPAEPWKNATWRVVVREFVGGKLTPPIEPSMPDNHFKEVLAIAEEIADPDQKARFIREKAREQNERTLADYRWFDLYSALDDIFPRPLQSISAGSSTVLSTAVAGIIVMAFSPILKGPLIGLCITAIVLGFLYQLNIARNHLASDRNGAHQVGMMIRELQTRARPTQPDEQPKPMGASNVASGS